MGETGEGEDVGRDLTELITKVNERPNVEEALEELSVKLADQLEAYEDDIIKILSDW